MVLLIHTFQSVVCLRGLLLLWRWVALDESREVAAVESLVDRDIVEARFVAHVLGRQCRKRTLRIQNATIVTVGWHLWVDHHCS